MITSADLRTIVSTGNPYIDGLLFNTAFRQGYTITYAFRPANLDAGEPNGGSLWAADGAANAFNAAMALWAEVANISYSHASVYSGNPGQYSWVEELGPINDRDAIAYHYYPGTGTNGGKFDNTISYFTSAANRPGGLSFVTFLHEIGHGLGLDHPHDGAVLPGVDGDFGKGDFGLNQGVFTVMSYNDGFDGKGFNNSRDFGWSATPMALDIAAIQSIYGANLATRTGNDTYVLPKSNTAGTAYRSIWDAGGRDIIVSDSPGYTEIDLRTASLRAEEGGGGWLSSVSGVFGGFTIAHGVVIEDARGGTGANYISANDVANLLTGGPVNDTLLGLAGADTLLGREGDNWLEGGEGGDSIVSGGGRDYILGGAGDDTIASGDESDDVSGGEGNDVLNTGGGADLLYGDAGVDTLIGGAGNDAYWIQEPGDVIIESDNGGIDEVIATIDYVLPGSVENLFAATGLSRSFKLTGNEHDNSITGGQGRDTLIGAGGADQLEGDLGGDVFVYSAVLDSPSTGADTIKGFDQGADKIDLTGLGFVSITISAVQSGRTTVTATGQDGVLAIAIVDPQAVSLGDLLFVTGNAPRGLSMSGQVVSENAVTGTTVGRVSASDPDGDAIRYSLSANPNGVFAINASTGVVTAAAGGYLDFEFERTIKLTIRATDSVGLYAEATFTVAIGDVAENNRVLGTSGSERVLAPSDGGFSYYGLGGNDTIAARFGRDTMVGGAGDDFYYVRNDEDVLLEAVSGGRDTALAYVEGYRLPDFVEELRLLGPVAHTGYGNALVNLLIGGGGSDTLYGARGGDTLSGNAGGDFLYGEDGEDRLLGAAGFDRLLGGEGDDRLEGGADLDALDGGAGDDDLLGNAGRDTLTGGAGADRFIFDDADFGGATSSTGDRIEDFDQAEGDLVDLRFVDAVAGGADNAFAFIGRSAFTGAAGQLRIAAFGADTIVYGDIDGDRAADFAIRLAGVTMLEASDFLF